MSSKKNERLKKLILASLDELKAKNINVLSVAGISSITDWMIIADGTSSRHVKALANNVELNAKKMVILLLELRDTILQSGF